MSNGHGRKCSSPHIHLTENDQPMTQASTGQVTRRTFLKAGVFAAGGLALYAGEIERHWIDVQHVDIRLGNLPEAFRGFRIAHMADFHYGEYSEPTFIRSVVRRVNALRPDLIALTGDFISAGPMVRRLSVDVAYHCADLLGKLECPRKFASMGNHDVLVSRIGVTDALESRGIPVLHNHAIPIEKDGARLWLAGVADTIVGTDADLSAAIPLGRQAGSEPLILMAHEPDYADEVVGSGVDLMLSGHTHGGQVRIPFMPLMNLPPMGKKYVEGHFSLSGLQLYVTRGIGTVGVPFRFRCPPEITLITLV
jgi:predicted MPP superfamily phosphohydrolase